MTDEQAIDMLSEAVGELLELGWSEADIAAEIRSIIKLHNQLLEKYGNS